MKKSFWQTPYLNKTAIFCTIIYLLLIIFMIIGSIISASNKGISLFDSPFLIFDLCFLFGFLLLLFYSLKSLFHKVIYDGNKVVVKSIFGRILNECKIEDIQKVYKIRFSREGDYLILVDNRKDGKMDSLSRKKCFIRFQFTQESVEILQEFWKGDIITNEEDLLSNFRR